MATGRMPALGAPTTTVGNPVQQSVPTIPGQTGRMPVSPTTAGRMPASTQLSEPIPKTPWGFVSGFATNLARGVVDTVKGLGQLFLVAPAHDVIQGVQHVIPGQQQIESEPSMLATVARTALPGAWVPGPDLGGKWGAIASDYAHRYGSPTQLAKGLYEDPISYVMDALMVADGIGLIAKSGRVGMLAKMPELVGDATAAKILGPALKPAEAGALTPVTMTGEEFAPLARYAEVPYASFSRTAGAFEGVGISKNMLIRYVQNKAYGLLSRTPEEAGALATTTRESEVAKAALEWNAKRERALAVASPEDVLWTRPMRVLKETPGRLLAQHEQSKVLSALRIRLQDGYQQVVEDIRPHVKKTDIDIDPVTGQPIEREVDELLPYLYDQALSHPDELPNTDPYTIDLGDYGRPISAGEASKLAEEVAPFKPETAVRLGKRYGEQEGGFLSHETPYAGKGGAGGKESYAVSVGTLDDAPRAAREMLDEMGYGNDVRIVETVSDAQNPWEGIHAYGRDADGNLATVSAGTPDMIEAQRTADFAVRHLDNLREELRTILAKADEVEDPAMAAVMADKIKALQTEAKAVREYLKHEHFYHTRASHWADKINPETGRVFGYNPELKRAMGLRPVKGKHITARWMAEEGAGKSVSESLPFTKMMDRKFTAARMERLYGVLAELQPKLEAVADTASLPGRVATAAKYLNTKKVLTDFGIPEDIAIRIMGGAGEDVVPKASTIISRARDTLWDYTIKEGGGGGGYDFAPWDWRVMQDEMVEAGLPVPSYLPNLPQHKPSSMAMKRTGSEFADRPGLFAKDWNQVLFERGEIPKDINLADAMIRAARVAVTHDEMKGFLDNMFRNFGRQATQEEATSYIRYGDEAYEGEFFFDPGQAMNLVDLRSELLSKTLLEMPGNDVMTATLKAIEQWKEKVAESGLNGIAKGKLMSIPQHIADMIDREVKLQFGTNVKLFWDTPMKVWKASVLSLSPRWVLNNTVGNLIFTGIENPSAIRHTLAQADKRNRAVMQALLGVDPVREVESGFWHEMTDVRGNLEWEASVAGKPTLSQVKRAAMGGGIDPQRGALANIARPAIDMGDEAGWNATLTRMNAPSRALQTWSRGVRNFNSQVEEAFRRGILIDELSRSRLKSFGTGLESSNQTLIDLAKNGVTPKGYELALNRVDRVIGNFTRYSPLEQNVIRRYFMPFYGFYRHMVNVLLKLPIEHPLKGQIFNQVAQMDEIMNAGVPSYMQNDSPLHIGSLFGQDTWLRLKNLNPLSQATEEFGMVNLFNPALKMAIERGLGVNTFTGDPFDPETLGQNDVIQTQNGEFWKVVRDETGAVIDVERTGRPLPSLLQHTASQLGLVSMLPSFSLYPKSVERNLLSWLGVSTSQPTGGTEQALQYDAEMKAEALARASGGSGFGDFGSFGSFGSF